MMSFKKTTYAISGLLLTILIVSACGPSQAEIDAIDATNEAMRNEGLSGWRSQDGGWNMSGFVWGI
jgi:hypothetical protein